MIQDCSLEWNNVAGLEQLHRNAFQIVVADKRVVPVRGGMGGALTCGVAMATRDVLQDALLGSWLEGARGGINFPLQSAPHLFFTKAALLTDGMNAHNSSYF